MYPEKKAHQGNIVVQHCKITHSLVLTRVDSDLIPHLGRGPMQQSPETSGGGRRCGVMGPELSFQKDCKRKYGIPPTLLRPTHGCYFYKIWNWFSLSCIPWFSYGGLRGSDVMKLVLGTLLINKLFIQSSYTAQIRNWLILSRIKRRLTMSSLTI